MWGLLLVPKFALADCSATSSDSSKVYDIDEIVVVSQPKETYRLRQQALSSTSLSGYQMQKVGANDLRDISLYVPNFVMPNYGSRLSSALYVRGIGSRVNSPAVGIYLDGIPVMSKAAFNLHNYQLSRVDVLRGPQGTLYGQNSEGGLVKMFSRNPFDYEGTEVSLGAGARYYFNVEAATYQRLNQHFAFSLAGFLNGQKGFFRNSNTGDRADKYKEAGTKFLLKSRLGNGWSLDLLANYQYVDQNGFPYGKLDLETGKADLPASTFAGNYRRNSLLSGIKLNYTSHYYEMSSVTSYQYLKDCMLMDQDYLPADYMHILQEQLQNSLIQELTFKSRTPIGGIWNWTLGSFFSYEWLKTNGPVYFDKDMTLPIGNAIQQQMYQSILGAMSSKMMQTGLPESLAEAAAVKAIELAGGINMDVAMGAPGVFHTPQWNLGLYHESNIDIASNLHLTLGLRYDFMNTSIHYQASSYMAMAANVMGKKATYTLISLLDSNSSDSYNQLLPKVGLTIDIDRLGSNIYATVSKGYRAGGYNIQMFSDILQTELNANRNNAMKGDYEVSHTQEDYDKVNKTITFKPETSWNYEMGTHLNLFRNAAHLDLSVFYMQVRNQQLSVMAGNYGFGRMMVNAGKSYSCGIEAAIKGQSFNSHLDWMLNYGYTRAKFEEYKEDVSDKTSSNGKGEGTSINYKNNWVPYVPQNTLSVMADYHFYHVLSLHALTIGVNMNAQGKTYWDNANTYSQSLYAVMGAHVDMDFGAVQLSIWAKNLTDNNYNTFAVDNSATGKKEYFAQRGNPFQMGINLKIHF